MSSAGPLVVSITDLLRRPGERRRLQRTAPLGDVAITTAQLPAGAEIELDLVLEAVLGGLTANGEIRSPWVGECRRCLRPVEGMAVAQVQEVFERHPTDGETYPLGDDHVDLEPMVREAVLLSLPLAPLCSDDCRGPDPDRFPASPEADDPGAGPPRDPRWAALEDLRFDE